jgi:hypothetical protein
MDLYRYVNAGMDIEFKGFMEEAPNKSQNPIIFFTLALLFFICKASGPMETA